MHLLHPRCQYITQNYIDNQVARSLAEDIGEGDISAQLLVDCPAQAQIVVKEQAIICGIAWAQACFLSLDSNAKIHWHASDGDRLIANTVLANIHSRTRSLVSAERSALNFLQFLSATATYTDQLVALVDGTHCTLLDTRKTLPGMRLAQKYAVLVGGAQNHRLGLYDEFLLKENHLTQSHSIHAIIAKARSMNTDAKVVVEVENLIELQQALDAKPDRILLDNFTYADITRAVALAQGKIPLEVSGNVTLANLRQLATSGVGYVSMGVLTKNVQSIDLSMRISAVND